MAVAGAEALTPGEGIVVCVAVAAVDGATVTNGVTVGDGTLPMMPLLSGLGQV